MSADEFQIDEWLAEDVTAEQKKDWPAWAPVWQELIFSGLSDRAVRLYAALSSYSGLPGIWPSRKTLGERLGCSPDTIDRAKNELIEAGWISSIGRVRPTDGGQTSNLYQLHQSATMRQGGRGSAAGGSGKSAAPIGTHILKHNPPTPQKADAESGQAIRTYPSSPLEQDDRVEPTASGRAQLGLIKDKLRPPRESEAS
jgi:hypothetical protein